VSRAAIRLRRTRPGSSCPSRTDAVAIHTRRGLPSPKPSSSPRGESLTTSVIKRSRPVNT
jgi:hypothetical protein